MTERIEAVAFDLGGVILESPLDEIARFEAEHGIEVGIVNRVVREGGPGGAWAAHERGDLDHADFVEAFGAELERAGAGRVDVDALMRRIEAAAVIRPAMLAAVGVLRGSGRLVAAVTNNWSTMPMAQMTSHFDLVVESWVARTRKPEERIYQLVVDRLGVEASRIVFLDDLGANLKPARRMGMTTIKVVDPMAALASLAELTGLRLV